MYIGFPKEWNLEVEISKCKVEEDPLKLFQVNLKEPMREEYISVKKKNVHLIENPSKKKTSNKQKKGLMYP